MKTEARVTQAQLVLLCGSVFIIAACSLVYELLISSLSTYLLGSSVVHYSLTIGLFLFFMGIGAWFAQSLRRDLLAAFVLTEIAIGAAGGVSALLLMSAYAWTEYYYPAMLIVIAIIGILIGMELPILTRIVETRSGLRRAISQVMTFDYLGALAAALLFPFFLLPYFGHLLTAVFIGLLNLAIALLVCWTFRSALGRFRIHALLLSGITAAALVLAAVQAKPLSHLFEKALYEDPVVHSEQSVYQKLVLTRRGDDLRLYLDGNLQFSSIDEYRYHELLVHLPASYSANLQRVLVIGGGDGLAARELLRYPAIESITIVDLDSAVTALAATMPVLVELNQGSLSNPKVELVHEDAWHWLGLTGDLYDLVIIDLPDPENEALARLYSVAFYQRVARRMAVGAIMITQATSPWFARRAYWSIGATLETTFASVVPAIVMVPSFGEWGFFVAAQHNLNQPQLMVPPDDTRFANAQTLQQAIRLAPDLARLEVAINRIPALPLIDYYRQGWDAMNLARTPAVTGEAVIEPQQ